MLKQLFVEKNQKYFVWTQIRMRTNNINRTAVLNRIQFTVDLKINIELIR